LQRAQAKLLSQYMVKEFFQAGNEPRMVEVWDYLVELPGSDGKPKRLTIRVKGFGFDLPEPGSMVPVVVNRRRTKAHFDVDDPSISLGAQYERDARKRKEKAAADKADFEAKRAWKT